MDAIVEPPSRETSPAVDLHAPMVPQMRAMGDDYFAWVHRPLRGQERVRLFSASWLERLSQTPWWIVPVVWAPVVAALVFAAGHAGRGAWPITGRLIAGLAVWCVVEYVLHRFVFHHEPHTATTRQLHFLAHGVHHLTPSDRLRLVFPPIPAALIALGLLGMLRMLLPPADALAMMAGLVCGYIAYDLLHYYTHHGRPRARVGRWLQRYHLMHHHSQPQRMFGVSQPLVDWVAGTYGPTTGSPRDGRRTS